MPGVCLPAAIRYEVQEEAARLDRGVSWIMARAWTLARSEIRALPTPKVRHPEFSDATKDALADG